MELPGQTFRYDDVNIGKAAHPRHWRVDVPPVLYVVVEFPERAADFSKATLTRRFEANVHFRYPTIFEKQRNDLFLVKGGPDTRLLRKAHRLIPVR